jgi:hypothetical protein
LCFPTLADAQRTRIDEGGAPIFVPDPYSLIPFPYVAVPYDPTTLFLIPYVPSPCFLLATFSSTRQRLRP